MTDSVRTTRGACKTKRESGEDGNIEKTEGKIRGSIISFGKDHGISIRAYKTDSADSTNVANTVKLVKLQSNL